MTFQDMGKNGLYLEQLDTLYPNATGTGKTDGVFSGRKEKSFTKAWGAFYTDLMQYFADNGFVWKQPTSCFNKIYFSADGSIAYWFFNFSAKDSIPDHVQAKYLELITQYSKNHRIKIKGKSNFSQCASVTFYDFEKKKD